MRSLAIELWAYIASFSHRADLMRLALVSSTYLAVARRIFCRSVRVSGVHGDHIASDDILNYLVKYNMTSVVREIIVFAYGLGDDDRKTIIACPNLRSLTLVVSGRQSILESASAQRRFVTGLKESCPVLEEFRLNSNGHVRDRDFSVPNLKVLKWKEHGKISRSLISLCEASLATLTDISITVYDGLFPQFFRFLFPKLVTFRVGPGHESFDIQDPLPLGSALTTFLITHPNITHLELIYSTSNMLDWATTYVPLDLKALSPNVLPKLRMLEAHPNQVCDFLSAEARFFKRLPSLRLNSCTQLMMSKFLNYAKMNGPCDLRELNMYRNTMENSSRSFDSYIGLLAAVFPSLERWQDATPWPFDAGTIAKSLSLLPSLREIIMWDTVPGVTQMTPHDAEIFAINLPLLESIESRKIKTIFEVSRPNSGSRLSITSRPSLDREQQNDYHEDSEEDNDCPDTDEYYSSDSDNADEGDE